ncbi:MAG: KEOPS complex subunit Cgi121 [Candidatus Baldrarchaeia archaeon]
MPLIELSENDRFENLSFVLISGVKDVKIDNLTAVIDKILDLSSREGLVIQLFDATKVASWKHLFVAALNALKAFKHKYNISSKLGMEILIFASGQRQIRDAISMLGLSKDTKEVAVVILGSAKDKLDRVLKEIAGMLNGRIDDSILEILSEHKVRVLRGTFGISDEELETSTKSQRFSDIADALVKCIINRSSLLVVQR